MLRSKKYQYKGAYENECRKNPSSFITGLLASVTIFKVKQLFIVKDFVSQGLRSHLVYKFACAGCNTSYIGETDRHVSARGRGAPCFAEGLSCVQTSCVIKSLSRLLFHLMFHNVRLGQLAF